MQLGKGRADLGARSRQIISMCILSQKYIIRKLLPEGILNEAFTDYHITEKNILLVPGGCATANTDHQSKLNLWKARTKTSCCGRGSNLSHVRHVHQNNIVMSNYAG